MRSEVIVKRWLNRFRILQKWNSRYIFPFRTKFWRKESEKTFVTVLLFRSYDLWKCSGSIWGIKKCLRTSNFTGSSSRNRKNVFNWTISICSWLQLNPCQLIRTFGFGWPTWCRFTGREFGVSSSGINPNFLFFSWSSYKCSIKWIMASSRWT